MVRADELLPPFADPPLSMRMASKFSSPNESVAAMNVSVPVLFSESITMLGSSMKTRDEVVLGARVNRKESD